MKAKPNISEFLDGATSDKVSPARKPDISVPGRITKTIRLAPDIEAAIKEAAHARWQQTGKKVSESDIVEEALRKYLNI